MSKQHYHKVAQATQNNSFVLEISC